MLSAEGVTLLPELESELSCELLSWDCAWEEKGIRSKLTASATTSLAIFFEDTSSMRISNMGNPLASSKLMPQLQDSWQSVENFRPGLRLLFAAEGKAKEVVRES
jgi:hypothetical protein